jgi:hypothetical protein
MPITIKGEFVCLTCRKKYLLFSDDDRKHRRKLCRGCDEFGIITAQRIDDVAYYRSVGIGHGPDSFEHDITADPADGDDWY